MLFRAYWQFYKDCLPFSLAFTLVSVIFFGNLWGIIFFLTIGIGIGFLGFMATKNNEYYFYYNLGLTKLKLFKTFFLINFFVAIPILILLLFISFLFGDFTIT